MKNKKKILVTGGDGRFSKILKLENKKLNLIFCSKYELDILKPSSIEKVIKKNRPDIIFHCAGLSRPMSIHKKNIAKSIDLNIIGTAQLTKVCKKFNIKLIYFSSGYVYEGKKGNYSEIDSVKPFNNYGLSKLGGECSVAMYSNSLILRITMTERPFTHNQAYTNLKTNFMYHDELVNILPKLINKYGIINVGGKIQSVYDFAKKDKPKIKKIKAINNKEMPLNQTMNINKLKKIMSKK